MGWAFTVSWVGVSLYHRLELIVMGWRFSVSWVGSSRCHELGIHGVMSWGYTVS